MNKNILFYKNVFGCLVFSFLFIFSSCKKNVNSENEFILPDLDENIENVIPHIFINIENEEEVIEKEVYLNATIEIKGYDKYESLSSIPTRIRGRGNDSWTKPKKPFRLNLDNKTSILGLPAAKNWVLLANYQDYTLMTNAVAMKIAQLLNMPYTNTIIPVDVTINGVYRGNYTLTQHIEIGEGRVDVGNDGVILELDSYFDEEYQFKSNHFNLPVMLKDAEVNTAEDFAVIQEDFQKLENLITAADFPNNNYGQYFDKLQFVKYLIVYNLTTNLEINHPKSVFIHKKNGGKYTMGPVWDFDWGFGFSDISQKYFELGDVPLLSNGAGALFFSKLLEDPEVINLYKQQWALFKDRHLEELLNYIDKYATLIEKSKENDFELWKVGPSDYTEVKKDLKAYIRKRAHYMDANMDFLK